MATETFDALAYFEKLKNATFTEEHAGLQVNTLHEALDEKVVSGHYLDLGINNVDSRIRKTEPRLQNQIAQAKYSLLKWQIGGWIGLAVIMAKGFVWLEF